MCWTFLVYLVSVLLYISNHKYAISITKQHWIWVICLFAGTEFTLQKPYMSKNVARTEACVSDFVSLFMNTRTICISMPSNVATNFPNGCVEDASLSLQAFQRLNRQSDVSPSLSSPTQKNLHLSMVYSKLFLYTRSVYSNAFVWSKISNSKEPTVIPS